jgi:hypothetical protein
MLGSLNFVNDLVYAKPVFVTIPAEVVYIYTIRVGFCIRNAKSAQYHKDRLQI